MSECPQCNKVYRDNGGICPDCLVATRLDLGLTQTVHEAVQESVQAPSPGPGESLIPHLLQQQQVIQAAQAPRQSGFKQQFEQAVSDSLKAVRTQHGRQAFGAANQPTTNQPTTTFKFTYTAGATGNAGNTQRAGNIVTTSAANTVFYPIMMDPAGSQPADSSQQRVNEMAAVLANCCPGLSAFVAAAPKELQPENPHDVYMNTKDDGLGLRRAHLVLDWLVHKLLPFKLAVVLGEAWAERCRAMPSCGQPDQLVSTMRLLHHAALAAHICAADRFHPRGHGLPSTVLAEPTGERACPSPFAADAERPCPSYAHSAALGAGYAYKASIALLKGGEQAAPDALEGAALCVKCGVPVSLYPSLELLLKDLVRPAEGEAH